MKKPAIVAAAALIGFVSFSSSAEAGDRGGAIAAGVIGGLAVGAIAGAAIADSQRRPAYAYGDYEYVPVYRSSRAVRVYHYEPAPYYDRYGYTYSDYDYGSWHDY